MHVDRLNAAQKAMSEEEVKTKLVSKAVEVMHAIVSENQTRMANYETNRQLLNVGIYYPNEYFKALKRTNQPARVDFLIKNGSFWHGFAPVSHFSTIPTPKSKTHPTGILGCSFVINMGVLPSDALASLRQKTTLVGCAETCQIAYYEAIRHVLGEEKFNKLFAADSFTPLKIGQDPILRNPIGFLMMGSPPSSKFVKGRIYQFANTHIYPVKHVTGGGDNFFALCMNDTPGKETFTTLGLNPKGITYTEMKQVLVDEFNKDPIGTSAITPELAKYILNDEVLKYSEELKDVKISVKDLTELKGGAIVSQREIGADRVTRLANASIEEAKKILSGWVNK